jgi:hypothetical protein
VISRILKKEFEMQKDEYMKRAQEAYVKYINHYGEKPLGQYVHTTIRQEKGRLKILFSLFMTKKMIVAAILAVSLAATAIIGYSIKSMLDEAAALRKSLDGLRATMRLDEAIDVKFEVIQPNRITTKVLYEPAYFKKIKVTYDNGENWIYLYEKSDEWIVPGAPESKMDTHEFILPSTGSIPISARLHAEYIPDVIKAFPEYAKEEKTNYVFESRIIPEGIAEVIPPPPTQKEISMGFMPLNANEWEIVTSINATTDVSNDLDGSLNAKFKFNKESDESNEKEEYVNLSASLPGSSPKNLTVSLKDSPSASINLTSVSVNLLWNGPEFVMEPKLIDDHGKTVSTLVPVKGSNKIQSKWIPIRSFKGVGTRTFDFQRIRRFEIAITRKAKTDAKEGELKIQSIELLGTKPLPTVFDPKAVNLISLKDLPLEPNLWEKYKSNQAEVELSTKDGLVCVVNLNYNKEKDQEPPWTEIKTQLTEHDFKNLWALEIEYKLESTKPITIETNLYFDDGSSYRYGRHIWIKPSEEFQKIIVYVHQFKFYDSRGPITEKTRMNLGDLREVGLGISRKNIEQAEVAKLYIKSIRLLGPEEQK